ATRLRKVAPHATPNTRLIEIGDRLLQRDGRLVQAIKRIGRGAETDGRASFVLPVTAQAEIENRAS
ncbi:MAG: protein tyrosine phosphatase, partial [Rhizobiaceae bacterium]